MSRIDMLLDDNYDIIDDGEEWVEGESEDTDVELIFLATKGENREFPFCGFEATKKLKKKFDEESEKRALKIELEQDGFMNPIIEFGSSIMDIKITV